MIGLNLFVGVDLVGWFSGFCLGLVFVFWLMMLGLDCLGLGLDLIFFGLVGLMMNDEMIDEL